MTPLFVSYVCDFCDGHVPISWHSGFIVFRGDSDFGRPIYVFRSRTDAAMYRSANHWQQFQIREIRFESPVVWKIGSGKLDGVTMATRPFELHRDHRFEPLPHHGYLVPISGSA